MSMLQTEDIMKSVQAAMNKENPKFSKLWSTNFISTYLVHQLD